MLDQNEINKAFARLEQRKLAEAKRIQEIKEAEKALLAPPPSRLDLKHINQIRRTLESQERELKRIEQIRDTDLDRYFSEKLDARYEQLKST
jgi:hypothetical protein